MSDLYRSCRTCHKPTEPLRLDAVSGEEKALTVTLHRLNLLSCPGGHKQFLRAEFPLELLNHLMQKDEPQLPVGDEKGLIFKNFFCHDCGRELEPKADHRHSFSIQPELADQKDLKIDLTMAVYRCTGCGKEQLHSLKELHKLTPAALAHAFQAAGIQSG